MNVKYFPMTLTIKGKVKTRASSIPIGRTDFLTMMFELK